MQDDTASRRFDRIASNFATSEVHTSSPTIRRLHELVPLPDAAAVCDVACGAGHLVLSFAARASRLVGVDPAPNMLAALSRLAEERGVTVELVEAFAEEVPLADGDFDLVVSRLAPHHFRDVGRAVAEMARLAGRGGLIAVIDLEGDEDPQVDDFNHRLEVLHDPTHIRSYTASHWCSLFKAAGLRVVTLERRLSERPGGITVRRWCEIAASGERAEREIVEMLETAPSQFLTALGIVCSEGEFRIPVRTLLILGQKSDAQPHSAPGDESR